MDYKINLGAWNGVFAVPNAVVDKYILLASGASIKVLLYLLKNTDKSVSQGDIALNLKISEETVSDAINFWVGAGLLCEENGELTPSKEKVENSVSFVAEVNEKSVNVRKVKERKVGEMSPAEIAERINGSEEIKMLFSTAEKIIGKPLNYTDQRTLIRIVDYLGISTDIVLILLRYCKSIDKCSMRYVESVASAWADEGIKTHTDADNKIKALKRKNKLANKVKSAFGIERNLSKREMDFVEKWTIDYKMNFDMIAAAYQIMCNNGISKVSFAYIDKILMNWDNDNIRSLDKIPDTKKSQNKGESDASYDLYEFEKAALKSTPKGAKK